MKQTIYVYYVTSQNWRLFDSQDVLLFLIRFDRKYDELEVPDILNYIHTLYFRNQYQQHSCTLTQVTQPAESRVQAVTNNMRGGEEMAINISGKCSKSFFYI